MRFWLRFIDLCCPIIFNTNAAITRRGWSSMSRCILFWLFFILTAILAGWFDRMKRILFNSDELISKLIRNLIWFQNLVTSTWKFIKSLITCARKGLTFLHTILIRLLTFACQHSFIIWRGTILHRRLQAGIR
jgi:hypothetical protein